MRKLEWRTPRPSASSDDVASATLDVEVNFSCLDSSRINKWLTRLLPRDQSEARAGQHTLRIDRDGTGRHAAQVARFRTEVQLRNALLSH